MPTLLYSQCLSHPIVLEICLEDYVETMWKPIVSISLYLSPGVNSLSFGCKPKGLVIMMDTYTMPHVAIQVHACNR